MQDSRGRSALDVSSPLVKVALQSRLLFCGRYELEDPPVHVSKTCEVVFAKDHRRRFEQYEMMGSVRDSSSGATPSSGVTDAKQDDDQSEEQSDGKAHAAVRALPVALKFMRSRAALKREIENRGGLKKDASRDEGWKGGVSPYLSLSHHHCF